MSRPALGHGRRFVLKFGGDDERERLRERVAPSRHGGPAVLPQEFFENNCAKSRHFVQHWATFM